MLQDNYYVIESENNDQYPMFSWDQANDDFGIGVPAIGSGSVMFRLGEPIPPKAEWVDYHVAPSPVISSLIADVLAPKDIYGVQLIPAVVRNPRDPFGEIRDYWFMHVWNRISCLDKQKSVVEYFKDGNIFSIDELVLDDGVLSKIELSKRLVFELSEKNSVLLVHESIKNLILSVSPRGCRFFKISDWNSDCTFE
ncbi:hypothetical protein P3G55_07350 [Leptospira sp. 96542]|nr:hypothetical protein [Leptospira sp. 96542]